MNNSYPGEINFDMQTVETSPAAQAPAQNPPNKPRKIYVKKTLTTSSWPKFSLDNGVVENLGKTQTGRTWILLSFTSGLDIDKQPVKATILCSKENEAIPADLTKFRIGDIVQVVGNFRQGRRCKNMIWSDSIDLYVVNIAKKV